ncbi:MAG: hypothetical protein NTV49_09175 [Kiritimatiellaeota bacterium]|nr:hypothetical protein [Kiritimatiellota bacterium]
MKKFATVFWVLVIATSMNVENSAFGAPKSQVTFRVADTNVMLLVKSSALSHAGRKADGKRVALFWSGSVKENGTVILLDPALTHSYAVILQGPPGSRPELSVEFEGLRAYPVEFKGRNLYPDTIRVQPVIPKNGMVKIHLWFMIHNDMAFTVLDPSSHWMPPPRPEQVRVRPGKEKGQLVLLWTQPRLQGMSSAVTFDVRWSTGTVSTARWEDETKIPVTTGLQPVSGMDVSSFVVAGARSFAVSAIDNRGLVSAPAFVATPALMDRDYGQHKPNQVPEDTARKFADP